MNKAFKYKTYDKVSRTFVDKEIKLGGRPFRKTIKFDANDFKQMMEAIEEVKPLDEEIGTITPVDPLKADFIKIIASYGHLLDDESIKIIGEIKDAVDAESIYTLVDEWYNKVIDGAYEGGLIVTLKGYQNTNADLSKAGIIIGHGGTPTDINSLRPEDFSRETQARCLSREPRYVGNTWRPYYVGQHCVVGAETFIFLGRPDLAKIFIRHEGSEPILRDMSKPVKDTLPDYEALQEKLDRYNAQVHGLSYPFPPEIKMLDKNLAQYEMTFMMRENMHTDYWTSDECEARFLETWDKIEYILDTYYN